MAIICILIFAYGCRSGNDDDDDTAVQPSATSGEPMSQTVSLEIGVPVEVFSGDQLQPNNAETRIRVAHTLNSTKLVTLLSGSADLIRGNVRIQ